jgi:hypothetical protein
MDVDIGYKVVSSNATTGVLVYPGQPGHCIKISTEESRAIRQSHMVGGSRTAPLGKQAPEPFAHPPPPPIINEQVLNNFLVEMGQGMVGVWGMVNNLTKDIQDIKSQNPSCSSSVTNLEDTSLNLRIGSTVKISEHRSERVEVMSVTTDDQPMDQTIDPGPSSSPNDTIELGCSPDELLAADSDVETEVTQEDDHLLSESEEETESPEEPRNTRWARNE